MIGCSQLKLTIAYDGTRYAGWQRQRFRGSDPLQTSSRRPSSEPPSIQETIERVLQRIVRRPVTVVASGRTDAGVHAAGQVAHVRLTTALSAERLLRSVNQLLPPDIAVLAIEPVRDTFHARFNTIGKWYRYRIYTGSVVPPFIRPYVHHVQTPLRVPLMRREARVLIGRHNVRAFARQPPQRQRSTQRVISEVTLRRLGPELHLDVAGTGFLHTMVRSIAGTLIDVGRGRLPPGTIRRMLRTGDRRLAGTTAPAKGLTLLRVDY